MNVSIFGSVQTVMLVIVMIEKAPILLYVAHTVHALDLPLANVIQDFMEAIVNSSHVLESMQIMKHHVLEEVTVLIRIIVIAGQDILGKTAKPTVALKFHQTLLKFVIIETVLVLTWINVLAILDGLEKLVSSNFVWVLLLDRTIHVLCHPQLKTQNRAKLSLKRFMMFSN